MHTAQSLKLVQTSLGGSMCTMAAPSNTSASTTGSQSGTTWSGVVDCRHHTRPDFVQCRRLPMFEVDGGRPGFHGQITL